MSTEQDPDTGGDAPKADHPDTKHTLSMDSMDVEKYAVSPIKLSGLKLVGLAFSCLGVIYSDIGTSPMYVLNGIWPAAGSAPSREDVIGGISAIIWALTIIPLLKYVVFALEFGTDKGEGGPFALFMGLFPKAEASPDGRILTTYNTNDGEVPYDSSGRLAKLRRFKWPLFAWTVFGTALTLADGILTPAVSVTTTVGGIAVAKPSVINDIVPISICFLICLFAVQRFGVHRISVSFAPVTTIWLLLIGCTGIYNITLHPGIFRAVDPSRAVMWFVRTKNYDYLAGVLLCLTGSEAMFANLSQFNKASIRLSFACFVYPMLVLAYLGQGASLIVNPSVVSSIFYLTIPGGTGGALYWIEFIFAILASLVASQAMISGSFSLLHQLIGMQAFPPLRIHHTSTVISGQIYIGAANWLLFIGTVAVVGGFGSSAALTHAYGFAVATVLFVTTTLIALSIPFTKNLPYVLGVLFLLVFGFFDGLFWGASLKKVPTGAWFPLALGGVLCIIMVFWAYCRLLESSFEESNSQRLTRLLIPMPHGPSELQFTSASLPSSASPSAHENDDTDIGLTFFEPTGTEREDEGPKDLGLVLPTGEIRSLTRVPVMAVFHRNEGGKGAPYSFAKFMSHYPALPSVVVFLTIRVVGVPFVPHSDRYVVNKVRSLEGFFSVTMRMGYLDRTPPSTDDLIHLITPLASRSASNASLALTRVSSILKASKVVSHVVPQHVIRSKGGRRNVVWNWVRRLLVEEVYARARVMWPDRVEVEDRER
ncbi:potassium uptake protein [Cryptococcus amylolentus CBS 6273]|uniref:Potassium uptake protein n=1 Tax=Cryptococcus amylolentus CBS 6273 TaxID=1296118 RepID=A0A1E3KFT1_9TREE|nr:potassium uptake protein [Cryptococcus amylolentus CBS 6273]